MHAFRITIGMSVAALAMATSACSDLPTAAAAGSADPTTAVSFSSQSRISLCHLAANGEYIEITVADAAYATHMAHGDIAVGPAGGCAATSRLTLIVSGGGPGGFVSVTLAEFGTAPATPLDDCPDGETCFYDVPTGASVYLQSADWFYYNFHSEPWWLCAFDTCVMESDVTVQALPY
jgi:hypothetical protein